MKKRSLMQRVKKFFTLIELLVGMAVFSILMLVMFEFFGQVQEIWKTTAARIELYDKARLILEIFSRDFEGTVSPSTIYKFYYKNRKSGSGSGRDGRETEQVSIASATRLSASSDCISRISEVEYYFTGLDDLSQPGKLFYRLIGDDQRNQGSKGWNIFSDNPSPPENPFDNGVFSAADIWKPKMRQSAQGKFVELIDCVSEFRFYPYRLDNIVLSSNPTFIPKEVETFSLRGGNLPDFVRIEVTIVDRPSWDLAMRLRKTDETRSDEILKLRGQRFMRIVHLRNGKNPLDVTLPSTKPIEESK